LTEAVGFGVSVNDDLKSTSVSGDRAKRSARYLRKVHRDREWLLREERKARGERSENEKFADELVNRLRRKDTRGE